MSIVFYPPAYLGRFALGHCLKFHHFVMKGALKRRSGVSLGGELCFRRTLAKFRPEIFESGLQSNTTRDFRLPVEDCLRLGDIWLADLWVVFRQGLVEDLRLSSGQANDLFCEVEHGDFIRVA